MESEEIIEKKFAPAPPTFCVQICFHIPPPPAPLAKNIIKLALTPHLPPGLTISACKEM